MDAVVNDAMQYIGADCGQYFEVTCPNINENQNTCASSDHPVSVIVKIVGFSQSKADFILTEAAFYYIAQPDYDTINISSEMYVYVILIGPCYFENNALMIALYYHVILSSTLFSRKRNKSVISNNLSSFVREDII